VLLLFLFLIEQFLVGSTPKTPQEESANGANVLAPTVGFRVAQASA